MKTYTLYGLGFVTIWDTITTVYGTVSIMGTGGVQIFISILFGLIISGFLINSVKIMSNPSEELFPVAAKILCIAAIGYDLYTSFVGNQDLILNNNSNGFSQLFITIGLTIFVSAAPIAISKILYDEKNYS